MTVGFYADSVGGLRSRDVARNRELARTPGEEGILRAQENPGRRSDTRRWEPQTVEQQAT